MVDFGCCYAIRQQGRLAFAGRRRRVAALNRFNRFLNVAKAVLLEHELGQVRAFEDIGDLILDESSIHNDGGFFTFFNVETNVTH